MPASTLVCVTTSEWQTVEAQRHKKRLCIYVQKNVDEGGLLDEVQIQCGLKHQNVLAYACRKC